MKKFLYIIIGITVALACSKTGTVGNEPEISNPPHNIIKAWIEDFKATSHIWSEGDYFGLYGSRSGENVRYVVEPISFQKSGDTRIYGSGVDGEVYGYYPYREEGYSAVAAGRQPLAAQQTYCTSALEQVLSNTVLVAKLEDERLQFSWLCGVLHVRLSAEVYGNVNSATLISGDNPITGDYSITGETPLLINESTALTVPGIDKPCGAKTPLDLYFMLPPGNYKSLSVSVESLTETIVKPIDISVDITPKTEVNCTVTDKETVYEGTDIIIINGEFDD